MGGTRYVLEVSSPGIDRRLVRVDDWRRFAGRRVTMKSAALGGRIEADLLGIDGPDGSETITVRDTTGAERRVALGIIVATLVAINGGGGEEPAATEAMSRSLV